MGTYQLCFLKIRSEMIFLLQNAETKERKVLARVLTGILSTANEAKQGQNFAQSPYHIRIVTIAAGAATALTHLEQGRYSEMQSEIMSALYAAAKLTS